MALPAGRYGVTKNQLLKIKKLPMNTIKLIEELTEKFDLLGTAAFKNSTSVVTDSSDLVESGAVKDIVGWGNKNLLSLEVIPSPLTDVSYTLDNGVITVTGTQSPGLNQTIKQRTITTPKENLYLPKGKYIFSCGGTDEPVFVGTSYNGNYSEWGTGTEVTFEITDETQSDYKLADGSVLVGLWVRISGTYNNTKLYPMVRKYGTNDTYEPYHASVEETIPQVVSDAVGWDISNLATELEQGTILSDGSEATNNARIRTGYMPVVKGVTYAASAGLPNKTVQLMLFRYNANKQFISQINEWLDNGYSEKVTDASYIRVVFRASDGSNITPSSFTYVKFLSESSIDEKKADNSVIGTVEDGTNPTKSYAVNEFMVRDGAFCQVTSPVTTSSTWTEGSNYTKKSIAEVLQSLMS